MPDSKISALDALAAAPAAGDLFVIVDVSDVSMAASGTDKKLAASYLLNAAGTATGATSQAQTFTNGIAVGDGSTDNPAIHFSSDADVGIYRSGDNQMSVTIASAERIRFESGSSDISPRARIINPTTTQFSSSGFVLANSESDDSLGETEYHIFAQKDSSGSSTGASSFHIRKRNSSQSVAVTPFNITAANNILLQAGFTAGAGALGYVGVGQNVTLTAMLDVVGSSTTRSSMRLRSGSAPTTANDGDLWNDGALSYYGANSTTNAIVDHLRLRRDSTGTAAAGFGLGIIAELESSTTNAQSAGRLTWEWATATHASRAAKGKLTAYYTSTERDAITWVANSTSSTIALNGLVSVSVPSGETNPAQAWYFISTRRAYVLQTATYNEIGLDTVDLGNSVAGPVITIGRNSNATQPSSGTLRIFDRAGTARYLWPDSSGNLRIHTAAPVDFSTDTDGTVVGAQSSSLSSKNVISEFTDYNAALQAVLDAPLYDFTYKSGAFGGEKFTGIITDHAPKFGMDNGKSLNAVTAHGYEMGAIKALNHKIEALQAIVARLIQSN